MAYFSEFFHLFFQLTLGKSVTPSDSSVSGIRTNEEYFSLKNEKKKIKNSQPQTKYTGSYNKKSVLQEV